MTAGEIRNARVRSRLRSFDCKGRSHRNELMGDGKLLGIDGQVSDEVGRGHANGS
jgi:hypothetical protein